MYTVLKRFRGEVGFVCFKCNLGCDFGRAYIASKKPRIFVYSFKEVSRGWVLRMF